MRPGPNSRCIAFEGFERIGMGELKSVVAKTKTVLDRGERAPVLLFDALTSELLEVDFRGTRRQVLERLQVEQPTVIDLATPEITTLAGRGPGRPRLGVVAREITLLPRHWEWLNAQPGGASVALRKLVDEARRQHHTADAVRRGQESTYRFIHKLAGDLPGFEEVTRALFAGDAARFKQLTATWPRDVRNHARGLAARAFQPQMQPTAG